MLRPGINKTIRRMARFGIIEWAYLGLFLPLLRLLPFSSRMFGPVKGHHPSFVKWIEGLQRKSPKQESDKNHWVFKIGPSEAIKYTPPILAIPRIPRGISERMVHNKCPRTYVARLYWGRIATDCFEVISPDDKVFDDFFLTPPGYTVSAKSLILPWLGRLKRKFGTYATIATGRASVYYHWINDCLTRLWLLESAGIKDFKLIVPKNLSPFHQQTLELLGFYADRLVPFDQEHWSVEQLLIPSPVNIHNHSSPRACRWLRERLISSVGAGGSHPKRIYIARSLAPKRRLINEKEIVKFLERYSFVKVLTETMSVRKQIQLFREAEIVVAPHGAGLTNILFMQEGRLVIELVHYRRAKAISYFSLANAVGLRYCCITDAPEEEKREVKGWAPDTDFAIPVERIDSVFRSLKI